MTTQLTNTGWFNGTTGTWTKRKDKVRDLQGGITVSSRFKPRTGAGDDLIEGAAVRRSGLRNLGGLYTQSGNDRVRGVSETQSGLYNEGTINAGRGNDKIIGRSADSRGVENQAYIYTGQGNDLINGRSSSQEGISNSGYINMGGGDDTLRGVGTLAGIRNDSYIYMGAGSDVVDARRGGFAGNGYIDMGPGFDRVFGFGPQTIDGGGDRDSLLLNQGKYKIANNTDEWGYTYGKKITDKSGTSMIAISFESIGSAGSLQEVDLKNGTLLINAMGEVSYL